MELQAIPRLLLKHARMQDLGSWHTAKLCSLHASRSACTVLYSMLRPPGRALLVTNTLDLQWELRSFVFLAQSNDPVALLTTSSMSSRAIILIIMLDLADTSACSCKLCLTMASASAFLVLNVSDAIFFCTEVPRSKISAPACAVG